jgi:urease accessory protein
LIRASSFRSAGTWSGAAADRVTLAYDDRHRRRIAMQAESGLMFLLDLAEATALRDGDGLVLEDGRLVEVRARPEPLLDVRGRDAHHLTRLAWHLGNRHVPAAIEPHRVLIRPDPVLAEMLAGLGAEVSAVELPFDPEGGAYAQAGRPAESNIHSHDHVPAHSRTHRLG